MPFKVITQNTKLDSSWQYIKNKTVLVLVIGETARSDRFGINGYNKQTTPYLSNREIIDFTETYSCGTSTAISLPCIFSHLDRKNYSYKVAKNTENLLDFFVKTNFSVQWRDNNTGCKGICDRTDLIDLTDVPGNSFCESGECFDEILLDNLKNQIVENTNNQIIVLHQKGSHGPAYYLRYPKVFEKFKPVCRSNQLQDCSQLELNDAYDNTILYTDYFLDKTINVLEKLPANYNSSLIYISDHGESLGENNLYLHGTPYFMAPDEQTHIPFFTWMSHSFTDEFSINTSCLQAKQNLTFSHDNFFHSVLGLMNVNTPIYNANLDVFNSCKQAKLIAKK
jgi:lipid A ethanolaminephosphotransferase